MATPMRYAQDFPRGVTVAAAPHANFCQLSVVHRVIFATSLPSSFDRRPSVEGEKSGSVDMICEAVEGSRRNMAHYSLMHMKIKSNNLPKYF